MLNIVKGRCPEAMGYSCNHDLRPVFAAVEPELATIFGQKFPVCCLAHYDTAVGYTCMHVPSELGKHDSSGCAFKPTLYWSLKLSGRIIS